MAKRTSRASLPSGMVTFLCTDVEGGTGLWERAGETMRRAMTRYDEVLRKSIERHGGFVFKVVGDALYAVFEKAENAVGAAVDSQYRLSNEPWPKAIGELHVRMGIHSGKATPQNNEYLGPTVNRATRIAELAHGGQIVVSAATASQVSPGLAKTLRDLGTHRLRDLAEAEQLFAVRASGIPSTVTPATSAETRPNNLPLQISSFVGRVDELRRLRHLVRLNPLVTIVGLGGIGKTRLALRLATEALAEFTNGSWFVNLKDVDDGEQILRATADALSVRATEERPIEETLVEALFKKKTLIVLDNAEHLLDSVADFARHMLETTPGLRIVVTSREPLHVVGENVVRIGPLDDSVRLFFARARSVRPELGSSAEAAQTVENICSKLQGIPLAIELAAARTATISISELDEQLNSQLLLSGERVLGDSPLRAMLEWSYRLLSPPEKRFLERLAVFEGTFTGDAAAAIAVDERAPSNALALLGSLSDKSLVSYLSDAETSRYYLLDIVREFAYERLCESGEMGDVVARHCRYYCQFVQSLGASNATPEWAISTLAREWNNIRAALRYAIELRADVEAGRWTVRDLWEFWMATGRSSEGWYWINRALEGVDVPARLRAELLQRAAHLAASRSDFASLEPLAKVLIQIHERSGDLAALGNALHLLANAKSGLGNGAEAEAFERRALEKFRAAGDRRGVAIALCNLGMIAAQQHLNYAAARQLMQHGLDIFRELSLPLNCAIALVNLSDLCARDGEVEQALECARESLAIFRQLGNDSDAGIQLVNIAEIYIESGKPLDALSELRAARIALGDRPNRLYLAYYFDAAFKLAVELKAYDIGAQIYGFATRYRAVTQLPLQPSEHESIDRRLAVLSKKLGANDKERLNDKGAAMEMRHVEGLISDLEPAPRQPSSVS